MTCSRTLSIPSGYQRQAVRMAMATVMMQHQDRTGQHEVTTNHNMREFFSKMWWGVFLLSSSATDCSSMDIMADIHDGGCFLIESMAPVCTADNHRGSLMMTVITTKNHCSRWPKNSQSEIQIKKKKKKKKTSAWLVPGFQCSASSFIKDQPRHRFFSAGKERDCGRTLPMPGLGKSLPSCTFIFTIEVR